MAKVQLRQWCPATAKGPALVEAVYLFARAVWEGKTLVVTVHFPEIKQDIRRVTWAIDADGQLVLQTEFLGGKPEPPTKEVFKRR